MKKLTLSLTVLLVASFSLMAATSESLFSAKELRFDAFATYHSQSAWGYGIGATYYHTKNLGLSVWTSKEDFDWSSGQFFQNLDTSLLLRVPLTDVVAPYVTIGSRWDIQPDNFVPVAGLGIEYRITKKFGAFVEGKYDFGTWDKWSCPDWKDVGVRGGIKLGF